MKNLNTGHVSAEAKNSVEKEFSQTKASISERTKPIFKEGHELVGVIMNEQAMAESEKKK
jgi:hypothetical protein